MWKTVPQHPHLQAHTDGRIRNAETGHVYAVKAKPDSGYLTTRILGATYRVHRLVAMAHCPNPDNKPHVNHIDFDRSNAAADNLEWCTPEENHTHSRAAGRFDHMKRPITNGIEQFESQAAAIAAGYSRDGLRDALTMGYRHHGYRWWYVGGELIPAPAATAAKAVTNGVETYPSINAAIRAGAASESGLQKALRKGWVHRGHRWRYA